MHEQQQKCMHTAAGSDVVRVHTGLCVCVYISIHNLKSTLWCFHPPPPKLFFSNVVALKKRKQREICDFLHLPALNLPGV